MNNPKTTVAGYIALAGTIMLALGQVIPNHTASTVLTSLGAVLSGGAASAGLAAAKDGGH